MDTIDHVHDGDGLRTVQATEEERAAIRAMLSRRAESAPAAAGVGRASAWAWAGLKLAALVLLVAGVGIGLGDGDEFDDVGCSVAQQPRYALRRDGGLWHLTFEGREAFLKHEQGIYYVAEMLGQPGERVKKLNLATKYSSPKSKHRSSMEVYDPATGKYDIPASTEPVHEAALAADDDEARNAYKQRARELLETINDPTETERAKEEAREELEEITAHLSKDSRQLRDPTKGAGDAVRNAINRLLHSLAAPGGSAASPPSVRRGFAEHLQQYLIIPSRRYAAPGARKARGDLTGCLLYDPPAGTFWAVGQ